MDGATRELLVEFMKIGFVMVMIIIGYWKIFKDVDPKKIKNPYVNKLFAFLTYGIFVIITYLTILLAIILIRIMF